MKLTKSKFQRNILIGATFFLIAAMALFMSRILIFNLTESLPFGLWNRTVLNIELGGVVGFCPTLPDQLKRKIFSISFRKRWLRQTNRICETWCLYCCQGGILVNLNL